MDPTLLVAGDVLQVIIESLYEGQVYLNVLHYECVTPPSAAPSYFAQLEQFLDFFAANAAGRPPADMLPVIGTNVTVASVRAQRVAPTRDFYVSRTFGQNGTYADLCGTGNVAAVITKRSTRTGRGRAGSFHLAGVPTGALNAGILDAGYQLLLEDLAVSVTADILEGGLVGEWRAGMYNATKPLGQRFSYIIDSTVQPTVRVERRRTVGVGI